MNGMKYQEIMLYVKEINKCKNNKIEELMNDVLTKKGYEGNDANNFLKMSWTFIMVFLNGCSGISEK